MKPLPTWTLRALRPGLMPVRAGWPSGPSSSPGAFDSSTVDPTADAFGSSVAQAVSLCRRAAGEATPDCDLPPSDPFSRPAASASPGESGRGPLARRRLQGAAASRSPFLDSGFRGYRARFGEGLAEAGPPPTPFGPMAIWRRRTANTASFARRSSTPWLRRRSFSWSTGTTANAEVIPGRGALGAGARRAGHHLFPYHAELERRRGRRCRQR